MKIYANDLCPCGSGRKYKKCCGKASTLKKVGEINNFPVYHVDKNADFYVDTRGTVVYKDETKQPRLDIPEGDTIKTVLSVGVIKSNKPIATIQEENGPICYILPDWYLNWCKTCVGISMAVTNLFPAEVLFAKTNGRYSADIL